MNVYMMNRYTVVSHITDQLGKALGKPKYQQQQKLPNPKGRTRKIEYPKKHAASQCQLLRNAIVGWLIDWLFGWLKRLFGCLVS